MIFDFEYKFNQFYNFQDVNVSLTEDGLDFGAQGLGIKGVHQYGFHLDFYLPVDPEVIPYILNTERKTNCLCCPQMKLKTK